jgi:predicted unusual protein kinase regulating ubiquinone biosynthesis (AarF/ABC1/UbiB family)
MVDRRSVKLLELVSDLGPTFIKVGLCHFWFCDQL